MLFCDRMPIHRLNQMTWTEVEALEKSQTVALLAVGAIEAHGPHLPLDTDGIIATSMAEAAARILSSKDLEVLQMPPVEYSAARFAAGFPGTISIDPEILTALVTDIAVNISRWQIPVLGLANAHLDPAHLRSLHDAVGAIEDRVPIRVAFPDLTQKPWGTRLTDEFKSGACHAGQFESSIILAASPERVRNDRRAELAPNQVSLSKAISEGLSTFEEAGGPDAYFGDPAAATADEGRETVEKLGEILAEAALQALNRP